MLGTVTASPSGVLVAFGAGILSFLSPCVLPLVPGYLSLVTGLSAAAVESGQARRAVLRGIGGFVAGFTLVFVVLGAVASSLGHALVTHREGLRLVSGVVVIAFGAVLILAALPAGVWRRAGAGASSAAASVVQERRFEVQVGRLGPFAAPVLGMAFAFAWTPCIGPVLGAVLTLAASSATVVGGVVLLLAYSMGLAVPFVLSGFAVARVAGATRRYGRALSWLQGLGGVVLVVFGVLLLTNQVSWLSTQFSQLLSWLHLGRLTTSELGWA